MVERATVRNTIAAASLVVLCCLFTVSAWGQNLGKIAGTVRDKQTNEPLVGVNVAVKGTTLGASTNTDGFYFILRVPAGSYDLHVSMIGYRALTIRGVKVKIDLTAEINATLEASTVELDEVVITAEQKLVQKDLTSTRRTVSRETMKETPGMESATDVFRMQAGTTFSASPPPLQLAGGSQIQTRDESLKDFHIRGGRGGEILYLVDGMPVTHPIYGGRSVVDLNVSDVESIELLTGAFNAEYGQAQSGVVNITTRSGGEKYKGGIEYKNDRSLQFGESYKTDYASFYAGGPEPITQELLPAIGVTVPGKTNLFVSGNFSLTDTPYDNLRTRKKVSILGVDVTERQDNNQSFNSKLNWDITGQHKLSLSYHGSWKQWSEFNWLWHNHPNNTRGYERNNTAVTLQYNHVLSKSTYYTLNLGYLGVKYTGSWNGAAPSDFWSKDSTGKLVSWALPPNTDPRTGFYDNLGIEGTWRDDLTHTYTFKGDLTSQVHPAHLIKAGIEVQYNDLSYVEISDGDYRLSKFGQGLDSLQPPGPYPLFGVDRWVFNVKPLIGSAYVQDKFELEYLILNAGARVDWFYLGSTVMSDEWKYLWQRATSLQPNWKSTIYKISPRLGISFPISENTVLFFSYGHFNQLPELQYYYRDPYSGAFAGNPGLDYEQTILYEFGFTHQISDFWAIDIKSYAKDISKRVNTTRVYGQGSTPVDLYDNNDYSRARGLEFEINKGYSSFLTGKATYTIQWATGYSSSAFENYVRSQTNFPYPIRERALAWDTRHQVIVQATLAAGIDQNPDVFGFALPDDWNFTLLFRFTTGEPYTPGQATINRVEEQKQENTARGPSTSSTDVKFEKGFTLAGIRLAFTIDIFNLFNQQNVQTLDGGLGFNRWTGRPYRYGDIESPQINFTDYYISLSRMNPYVLSNLRTTKIGLRIDF